MDYRAISQMELATQPFPFVQHEFRIFIEEKAFDRICNSADSLREVGGILVGEVMRDEHGSFIRVDDIIEALHAEESGTELTFTHATWNHIHQQMDTVYAGKKIIGWYHTHPNFGIFLSERDRFIQQSFFDLAFQIALVYDPVRREHGIFSWRENVPWRVRQYWIGTHEHLWDDGRDAPDELNPKRQKAPKSDRNESTAPTANIAPGAPQTFGDLIGSTWIMGAVLIGLLLGFALAMTWGMRNTQTATTTRAQTAQEAIASIDSDLLAVIRGSLSDEAFAKTFDEGIARLDRAAELLKPLNITDPAVKSAVQSVTEAQQSLSRARQDRLVAHEMLQQIEQVMRRTRTPEFVARDLAEQRAALAGVYVELARDAARNNDRARVSEFLKRAAIIDPANQAAYEQQLKSFEQQGTSSQRTEDSNNSKAQGAAPATSVTPSSSPGPGTGR
jgi:proteasome lid subunit RPN8/RPN11